MYKYGPAGQNSAKAEPASPFAPESESPSISAKCLAIVSSRLVASYLETPWGQSLLVGHMAPKPANTRACPVPWNWKWVRPRAVGDVGA